MKEELFKYLEGESDAISLIRKLSGMFNPSAAIDVLALICSITRVEQGDLDKDTFKEIWDLSEKLENKSDNGEKVQK